MAYLDISTFSGHTQSVPLDKRQAVSIGTHPSNDIQVVGDNVEIMHCRISWNKSGFEVVAAGSDGVDVNGTLVQKTTLEPGDLMRIGEADIRFLEQDSPDDDASDEPDAGVSTFGLKPLTGEIEVPLDSPAEEPASAEEAPLTADEIEFEEVEEVEQPRRKRRKKKRSRDRRRRERAEERQTGGHEEREDEKRRRPKSREPENREVDDSFDLDELAASADAIPAAETEDRVVRRSTDAAVDETFDPESSDAAGSADPPGRKPGLRERLRSRPQRPGERDAVRSPLVLSLAGGAAALVLMGLTFYFIINRQTTQARFDEGVALMEEGKYAQAIRSFEQFIALYPRDDLAEDATVQLGISRIERHLSGASPNWPEALKQLNAFINSRRDLPDFDDHRDGIRRRAEQIAEGAASGAGKRFDRSLLETSNEARSLLTRYSPEDGQPVDALKRIQTIWRASEAAILKNETLKNALAAIDAAIAAKRPMEALDERRELLRRYSDFRTHKDVVARLAEILKTEQSLVTRSEQPIDAVTTEHPVDVPQPLTLTFHARSRTDEVSVGRTIYGVAKDCCYAVDSITGVPVWRRVIGSETPFFPVPVDAGVPALIVFSTRHDEVQLISQKEGRLIWRQPGVRGVTGPPLVEEGQLYLVGTPGILSKLDLTTGQITSQLSFSQRVNSPVVPLLNDGRLIAVGNQEVVYTLSSRPLECVAVTFVGHSPGSIVAPVLPMGALVLLCENQSEERSLLRVLDSRQGDKLVEVDSATIPGHVIDRPVIRGRDVFVPSTGERVSSFSASDEPGQDPLSIGPRYDPEGAEQSPMYLATGPDRKVWMASRHLRQLQLTTDAIQPGSRVVDIGIATQPIQLQSNKLYVGRALPYSTATTLFQTDRDDLTSDWQAVIGGTLLAWGTYPGQQGLLAVNESGDVFRISEAELQQGGFQTTTTVRLNLPEGLQDPIGAKQLSDGRIAVWCGDPQPQLWLVNRVGQTDRPVPLPGPLQCAPALMNDRIVAAVAGKLHLMRTASGQPRVQEYSLPEAENQIARWHQLIEIDESTLLAATSTGTIIQIRLQTSPQTYLAEAGRLEFGHSLNFAIGVGDGHIAVANDQSLQLIDPGTLEPVAEADLPAPLSNDVWVAGGKVFAETARENLHVFSGAGELSEVTTIPLEGVPCAGAPLQWGSQILVCLVDGRVLVLDEETVSVEETVLVGQSVSGGPREIDGTVVVATRDGSLVRVMGAGPE